ncbi:MAG TPA: ABC transporter substrate-binding protein [Acidimicrobiia bacterium]|nr:ABC transporter substrate-binding protein [Acidimicrobiia bacterium]
MKRGIVSSGARFAAVVAVAALVFSACGSSGGKSSSSSKSSGIPAGDIKIGALLTLNGPLAAIGTSQKVNDAALVDALNATGGIAGHPVKLIALNDQGDPATAVAAAQQLVSDHVAGVIYAGTSATVTQTVPVFMKSKVPVVMLDPLDQWDDGAKYPYFFDNYPLNQGTTDKMAQFAATTLKATKVGVLTDGSTFGDTLLSDLKKSVGKEGVHITDTETYQPTSPDVTTQVRKLQSSGADALVLFAAAGMGHVYDAMRTVGWKPPIITTAASFFDGYTSLGDLGPTAYSNCAVALQQGEQPDTGMADVLKVVTAKTGVNPSVGQVVLTADDFKILKSAIEQTNSLDPDKIKHAIEGYKDKSFTTPTIRYTWSATHHGGWPNSQMRMCKMTPLGPYDLPYIAG